MYKHKVEIVIEDWNEKMKWNEKVSEEILKGFQWQREKLNDSSETNPEKYWFCEN